MVQGWMTHGDGQYGTQTTLHTSPSRHASIQTPRDQQDVPADKLKVLVAKHVTRGDGIH